MSTWGNHGQNLDYWLSVQVDSYKKVILYTLNSLGIQRLFPHFLAEKFFLINYLYLLPAAEIKYVLENCK